jgi:DNA-binding HxlR family transcriptional regulator
MVTTYIPPNVLDSACESRQLLDLIADKWSVLIIYSLSDGTLRFSDLRRAIGGISQKMLTQTLRRLEADGLINRKIYASVPPIVEYSLTPLGLTLLEPLNALCRWAQEHIDEVNTYRQNSK